MKRIQDYIKQGMLVLLLFCALLFGWKSGGGQETMEQQADAEEADRNLSEIEEQELFGPEESEEEPERLRFIDAWGERHTMTVNPDAAKHSYDWSCLTNTEKEIRYTGDKHYRIRKGVDVSEYQGEVDWKRVKASGCEFAILRIGYRGYGTKGSLHADARFHENIVGAKDAGLDVGVYFFSQAVDEEEALEEVSFVLDNLKGYELELPVVFDPEKIRDDEARTDDVSGEQFTKNTVLFCEEIKEAGYQPMVYSSLLWEAFEFDMEKLADYPIWYADYEPVPQTPYRFAFWQYSEKGKVDGIKGAVDLDVQFLSTNEFEDEEQK